MKNCLIGKDPDVGKYWRWEEKGMTEYKMVGWHYQLDGHEFQQAPGVGDGQGTLACCCPWGHKEWNTTEWLNWWFSNIIPRQLSKGNRNTTLERYMCSRVHCRTVRDCQGMEAPSGPTNRGADRENVMHTYTQRERDLPIKEKYYYLWKYGWTLRV